MLICINILHGNYEYECSYLPHLTCKTFLEYSSLNGATEDIKFHKT